MSLCQYVCVCLSVSLAQIHLWVQILLVCFNGTRAIFIHSFTAMLPSLPILFGRFEHFDFRFSILVFGIYFNQSQTYSIALYAWVCIYLLDWRRVFHIIHHWLSSGKFTQLTNALCTVDYKDNKILWNSPRHTNIENMRNDDRVGPAKCRCAYEMKCVNEQENVAADGWTSGKYTDSTHKFIQLTGLFRCSLSLALKFTNTHTHPHTHSHKR